MNKIATMAAAIAVTTLSACGANTRSSAEPPRATSHVAGMPANFAHGAEIESAPTLMVSEGNSHIGFPPGATLKRTTNGIEVTYRGVTRTFSSSARVTTGSYHLYEKPQK